MTADALTSIEIRLRIQAIAMQAVMRALAPAQAAQCAQAVLDEVQALVAVGAPELTTEVDEVLTSELTAVLNALGQGPRL